MPYCLQIALPVPLYTLFSYLSESPVEPGCRVQVPFRNKSMTGLVMHAEVVQTDPDTTIKMIHSCLDPQPLLSESEQKLMTWISQYYHVPIGDCFQVMLPKKIRQGEPATLKTETVWFLNDIAITQSVMGKKQHAIIQALQHSPGHQLRQAQLYEQFGSCLSSLRSLEKKQFIRAQSQWIGEAQNSKPQAMHPLNAEQEHCVNTILTQATGFQPFLLQGITGSGKTEVYLHLARQKVREGQQVLVLIPEIGLSNQLVTRFRQHLCARIGVMNSAMTDTKRKQVWLLAKSGKIDILIGTRSAVFTPFKQLGLIIMDEEHDASFKQQDGLRYHAKTIALVRAKKSAIPIVLGSATPSLESLYQVEQGQYHRLELTRRATGAALPAIQLINSQGPRADTSISSELYHAITAELEQGNQVLLFINRRGYAPVMMCHDCQWQAQCPHCDARLVLHAQQQHLCCHHCGWHQPLVTQCPQCQSTDLGSYGAGTERVEQYIQHAFPHVPVLRIDRDNTQTVHAFSDMVADIQAGGPKILVGTQMLAKGHDFHGVTLVGILDADQGLMSADFKATENLAQLVIQVTGRAGRGNKPGVVYIQTQQPQHPFWQDVIQHGYTFTAKRLLKERNQARLPPYQYLSLIRAEHKQAQMAHDFLEQVRDVLQAYPYQVEILGPVPALMEKKAGRYRAQLLLSCSQRKPIHQLLDDVLHTLLSLKLARQVRWAIDIDPQDLL